MSHLPPAIMIRFAAYTGFVPVVDLTQASEGIQGQAEIQSVVLHIHMFG